MKRISSLIGALSVAALLGSSPDVKVANVDQLQRWFSPYPEPKAVSMHARRYDITSLPFALTPETLSVYSERVRDYTAKQDLNTKVPEELDGLARSVERLIIDREGFHMESKNGVSLQLHVGFGTVRLEIKKNLEMSWLGAKKASHDGFDEWGYAVRLDEGIVRLEPEGLNEYALPALGKVSTRAILPHIHEAKYVTTMYTYFRIFNEDGVPLGGIRDSGNREYCLEQIPAGLQKPFLELEGLVSTDANNRSALGSYFRRSSP